MSGFVNIYKQKGYKNRREYLDSLADEYGVCKQYVYAVAKILGKSEDFDGLLSSLDDLCQQVY